MSDNKFRQLLISGELKPEDLVGARDLIARAELVDRAMIGCKQAITFPLGTNEVQCYTFQDHAGEYEAWGKCSLNGEFVCYSNWGGNHEIGRCNLFQFASIFSAFDQPDFAQDLKRFCNKMANLAPTSPTKK